MRSLSRSLPYLGPQVLRDILFLAASSLSSIRSVSSICKLLRALSAGGWRFLQLAHVPPNSSARWLHAGDQLRHLRELSVGIGWSRPCGFAPLAERLGCGLPHLERLELMAMPPRAVQTASDALAEYQHSLLRFVAALVCQLCAPLRILRLPLLRASLEGIHVSAEGDDESSSYTGQLADELTRVICERHAPALEVLDLVIGAPEQLGAILRRCARLRELTVRLNLVSSDPTHAPHSVADRTTALCTDLAAIFGHDLPNTPHLRSLSLDTPHLTDSHLLALYSVRSLGRLRLLRASRVTSEGIASLADALPALSKLAICGQLRTTVPEGQLALSRLERITSLSLESGLMGTKQLLLTQHPHLHDLRVAPLPRLVQLDLSGCSALGSRAVAALLSQTPALELLTLYACARLSELNLAGFAQLKTVQLSGCTALTTLSILQCPKLGGIGLDGCYALTSMHLCGLRSLRSAELLVLASVGPLRLRSLRLPGCALLSSETVSALAPAMRELSDVDLSHCPLIDTAAILSLTRHCGSSLTSLKLYNCRRLHDEALAELGARCPQLKNLDLRWCTKLSVTALGVLADQLGSTSSLQHERLPGARSRLAHATYKPTPQLFFSAEPRLTADEWRTRAAVAGGPSFTRTLGGAE